MTAISKLSRRKEQHRKNMSCKQPDALGMATDCMLESRFRNHRNLPSPSFFAEILHHAQNPDSGWGYQPGTQSSTEPTAWSILALRAHDGPDDKAISSAMGWLRRAQRPEGAWPTADGKHPGCWVTALACLALLKHSSSPGNTVIKGLEWLCRTWPAEGNMWWRLQQKWQRGTENTSRQDHSLRGWGWTPDTASWVEPTAFALLLFQIVAEKFYPPEAKAHLQSGQRMLYDRVCPGGGWNAGNPLVYGEPGIPKVGQTVWSLLALRNYQNHSTNVQSIEWLERNYNNIKGPGSLALAQLCLKVYGRAIAPIESRLHASYANNHFLRNIPVASWASLAAGSVPGWLACSSLPGGEA